MTTDNELISLKEWLIMFIKHKDIFYKKIINISEKENIVVVEQKENTLYFAILPHINDIGNLLGEYSDKQISIVIYNTKPNLDAVIKDWQNFSKLPMLSIYFVNPNSSTDKKWIIYPFTHSKITESSALKLGLQTLFESVEEYK